MERPLWRREETAPAGMCPPVAAGEGFEATRFQDRVIGWSSVVGGWTSCIAQMYREAYGGLPRAAWLLALLELVNRSGTMVIFFLTTYATRRLGFTVVQAGLVMSAYGVGSMLGTYLGGRLCDRFGAYHVQKLSLGASAVLLILLQAPRSLWLLALIMLALAAFSDAMHPANSAATAQICTPELRPKGFALHRLAGNLGVSVGPVVGGYLALRDYTWLFWVDGLTSLAACALALIFLRSAGPHGQAHAEAAAPAVPVWRNRPFLCLLPLVFGIALVFSQFFSTYPLYLRLHYGMQESSVGRLIAVNTLLIVTVEMLLMHALRRRAPARVVAIGTLLLGLGFGLTPFGSTVPFAVFSVVVWTFGEILTLPMLLTLTTLRSDPAAMGEYQGLTSLAFAMATTCGPLLGTRLWEAAGAEWVWYACAALGAAMALGFARIRDEATVAQAG
ncbi:MAG: MFS transporter [Betaproteobacteria bacterium]